MVRLSRVRVPEGSALRRAARRERRGRRARRSTAALQRLCHGALGAPARAVARRRTPLRAGTRRLLNPRASKQQPRWAGHPRKARHGRDTVARYGSAPRSGTLSRMGSGRTPCCAIWERARRQAPWQGRPLRCAAFEAGDRCETRTRDADRTGATTGRCGLRRRSALHWCVVKALARVWLHAPGVSAPAARSRAGCGVARAQRVHSGCPPFRGAPGAGQHGGVRRRPR